MKCDVPSARVGDLLDDGKHVCSSTEQVSSFFGRCLLVAPLRKPGDRVSGADRNTLRAAGHLNQMTVS